jgi:hypothetical protein
MGTGLDIPGVVQVFLCLLLLTFLICFVQAITPHAADVSAFPFASVSGYRFVSLVYGIITWEFGNWSGIKASLLLWESL